MNECSFCGKIGNSKKVWRSSKDGKYYCDKHHAHMRKYNKCFRYTWRDINQIIKYDTHAEIVILDIKNEEKFRVIIDIDNIDLVSKYKWGVKGSDGCRCYTKGDDGQHIFLYNMIMNPKNNEVVDHINRNPLDNRKVNLRVCTRIENNFNKSSSAGDEVGIYWVERLKKWTARITCNRKQIHLGTFENKNDAIKARKTAEEKYFKEFKPI